MTVWSFSPKTDPSYPSVVKRSVTKAAGGSSIDMKVLCESDKDSCDNLVRQFYRMNVGNKTAEQASHPISAQRLPNGTFKLMIALESTADVSIAQHALIFEARKVCGGSLFQFGKYSFESVERAATAVAPASPSRITLNQEILCGPVAPAMSPHTSYDWMPSAADDQVVAARTKEYLALKDQGDLTLAYDQFSDSMKAATQFPVWARGIQDFIAKAGPVELRKIRNVSWVKDPPGVDPGFYAAVDYSGKFKNIAHECGYVAWHRDASGQLAIVREEEGFIDSTSGASMTPDQLKDALARIKCADE
jgi:hypothetical protein